MKQSRVIALLPAMLLLATAVYAWTPSGGVDQICRQVMEQQDGYGPWRMLAVTEPEDPYAFTATRSYSDGFNTVTCTPSRIGPVWVTIRVAPTMVGCRCALDGSECQRKPYGVIPAQGAHAGEHEEAASREQSSRCP